MQNWTRADRLSKFDCVAAAMREELPAYVAADHASLESATCESTSFALGVPPPQNSLRIELFSDGLDAKNDAIIICACCPDSCTCAFLWICGTVALCWRLFACLCVCVSSHRHSCMKQQSAGVQTKSLPLAVPSTVGPSTTPAPLGPSALLTLKGDV